MQRAWCEGRGASWWSTALSSWMQQECHTGHSALGCAVDRQQLPSQAIRRVGYEWEGSSWVLGPLRGLNPLIWDTLLFSYRTCLGFSCPPLSWEFPLGLGWFGVVLVPAAAASSGCEAPHAQLVGTGMVLDEKSIPWMCEERNLGESQVNVSSRLL